MLSLVNSFKKVVSPALVLIYAVLEGLFVGAFSKLVVVYVGGDPSIVFGAVLGTVAAFGGTLAAYKFFNIQVNDQLPQGRHRLDVRVRRRVAAGLRPQLLRQRASVSTASARWVCISSVIGVVIAVFMLILDFDYVERGVAAGLPERESWRAAFGLTVTLVWLYIELLRILAILRGND